MPTAADLESLTDEQVLAALDALVPRRPCALRYGPAYPPSPKQQAFLALQGREVLYGGAAGGGKSDALLRAALQYVCVPGYSAVIFRQTYPQLIMDGGLVERAEDWLGGTDVRRVKSENRWVFPSGATLSLGHLERDDDRFKYAGAQLHYIGWDELTNWSTDRVYRFLASRLRRPKVAGRACPDCGMTLADVPLRIRAGTNPGGRGEGWVRLRFVKAWERWRTGEGPPPDPQQLFLPAYVHDNPGLDTDEYLESLGLLDQVTLAQLRDGVWGAKAATYLKAGKVRRVEQAPPGLRLARGWDMAATEVDEAQADDPDWTAGALLGEADGTWYVLHVRRYRLGPGDTEREWLAQLQADRARHGRGVRHRMEQEPGSGGKLSAAAFIRMGKGHAVRAFPSSGSKVERARPLAAAIDNERFCVVDDGTWDVEAYLDELELFPSGTHDDQVDATAIAMAELTDTGKGRGGLRS